MKNKNSPGALLCRLAGGLMIVAVILLCLPLTVGRAMGCEMFAVVSPSMEPEIPVGSLVYVQPTEPEAAEVGQVIAFTRRGTTVIHRVTENNAETGKITVKGDANDSDDPEKVAYGDFIGVVVRHFPAVGRFLMLYSQPVGKVYMVCFAACGVILSALANRIDRKKRLP